MCLVLFQYFDSLFYCSAYLVFFFIRICHQQSNEFGRKLVQVNYTFRIKHFYKLFACRLSPILLFLFNKGVYLAFTDIQTIVVQFGQFKIIFISFAVAAEIKLTMLCHPTPTLAHPFILFVGQVDRRQDFNRILLFKLDIGVFLTFHFHILKWVSVICFYTCFIVGPANNSVDVFINWLA